jgi:hypothetical protein
MAKKQRKPSGKNGGAAIKRRPVPQVSDEEEEILRQATIHLAFKVGMFLVATGLRKVLIKGCRMWIITSTLRFDDDDETYYGDLLYDGEGYTFLTEQAVMGERARKLADDPERIRRWNEYRNSTLHAGKT